MYESEPPWPLAIGIQDFVLINNLAKDSNEIMSLRTRRTQNPTRRSFINLNPPLYFTASQFDLLVVQIL